MVTERGRSISISELKRIGLRGGDRGKIQGEFEHHFFSRHPPKKFVFSWDLFTEWNERSEKITRGVELEDASNISKSLELLFVELFGILPKGKHITPELRNCWYDTYLGFLLEIWLKRRRNNTIPPNDSR